MNFLLYLFQLYFEGKLESKHSYIAVGGLYVTPGYCPIEPWNSYTGKNMLIELIIKFNTIIQIARGQKNCFPKR